MKTYNKFILALLGATLVVGTGSAQNWTVNGTPQSTQLTTSANEAAVAIDPATGAATVKTAGAGPSVAISANPTSVGVNAASTISWTASGFGNNLNCTRTGGWTGTSNVATSSVSVTMPATAQTVTLTLSCTGDNGTASNFTNVAVTSGGVDCSTRPPAVLGSPRVLINRQFSSLYSTDFPGIFGPTVLGSVADGTVAAYAFVAPVNNVISGFLLSTASPEDGRGSAIAAISECPGEISETPFPNPLYPCFGGAGKTRNEWTTTGRVGSCNLIPGRQYYYNFSTQGSCVSGPEPGTPGANCFFRLESKRWN